MSVSLSLWSSLLSGNLLVYLPLSILI
jgi:hypothetical protein